ncbi:MAG: DNA phosphorothioation-dependent restriction protein DptF [bacterium]
MEREIPKINGSALLYELTKLSESAQEAIEGSEDLSKFKKYLHVKRPIQDRLIGILENTASKEGSHLILLCGSVGDGKSHLLAYLNENKPELMSKFSVHNDATESFDPCKSSLETLSEVLDSFSDELIEDTNDKLILAINMGVLHNFLESNYVEEKYNKLASFIIKTNLFDPDSIVENCENDKFCLISFSDYHLYQLSDHGPKTDYILSIFNKIVDKNKQNPFYRAYLNDLDNGLESVILTNYRLLQEEKVYNRVADLVVMAIIKHKIIVSTRAILNFIYDIIVPSDISSDLSSAFNNTKQLFPNLLFDSEDRSTLLNVMSKLDPINKRNIYIDNLLIQLNNTNDVSTFFTDYLSYEYLNNWISTLDQIKGKKELLNKVFIRLSYFLSDGIHDKYSDAIYENFINYLYSYNCGHKRQLKDIYDQIKKAIYYWKGNPKANYIYMENSVSKLKIAQNLDIKAYVHDIKNSDKEILDRFKTNIIVSFKTINTNESEPIQLEIDYPLYEKVIKVLNGYRPNKKDNEDAIQFVEFIDKLVESGDVDSELLVHESEDKSFYKLEYDSEFEHFSFKKE